MSTHPALVAAGVFLVAFLGLSLVAVVGFVATETGDPDKPSRLFVAIVFALVFVVAVISGVAAGLDAARQRDRVRAAEYELELFRQNQPNPPKLQPSETNR